ncbi:MAG: serine/threonine protein kinase [Proteobacteria bacterium]|nr:MAG: serine/threonine protein kinase [Pseudomonadota bacterium]
MQMNHEPLDSFYQLTPEQVLKAIESLGFACNGYQLGLNSYENRVYQVGLDDGSFVVAKFYRPKRWSDQAILEEHVFTLELEALDIPVVPPLLVQKETLHHFEGYHFSLYPLRAGRAPDLENKEHLQQLGRFIGRIHALGAVKDFEHRPALNVHTFGDAAYDYLLDYKFIPYELEQAYEPLVEGLLDQIEAVFDDVQPDYIRLQGDAHPGNILWKAGLQGTSGNPYILDFDDARMGPAVQDLWMFISGDKATMESSLNHLLKAYSEFYTFNASELRLIEPLRTLRMLHHAAWLAKRWDDPVFKHAFPWFNTQNYWQEHILTLKEQAALLHEEPLQWI